MNEKNLKIVRYITGVLFLALAITSFLYKYTFSGSTYAIGYAIGYIVSALGAAIMAVSMFLGMRQVFIVGAGFQAVSCLIKLLALHENIMNILSAVLAAFAIQDKKNTSKYVIVSVVLFLIGNIANQIAFLTDKLSIIWALKDFVSVASPILLACIVFENIPQAQTTKMVKQPTKTAKSNDRIEELTKLKDLLDTGVISQEEFDAKKKQILGV